MALKLHYFSAANLFRCGMLDAKRADFLNIFDETFSPRIRLISEGNERLHAAERIENDERTQTTANFGRSQESQP